MYIGQVIAIRRGFSRFTACNSNGEVDEHADPKITDSMHRRSFIGGSDARIVMGTDEAALVRLWREKRDEVRLSVGRPLFTGSQVRIPTNSAGDSERRRPPVPIEAG